MLDKSDLLAIAELMDMKLKPMNEQLNQMQGDIKKLKEDTEILKKDTEKLKEDTEILKEDTKVTRAAVNDLLEWADDASIQIVPLFKKVK